MNQTPTVGRIVHYVSRGSADGRFASVCRAAVITEVTPLSDMDAAQAEIEQWDEDHRLTLSLCVLNPTGMFFDRSIHQDEANKAGGSWHWPERT